MVARLGGDPYALDNFSLYKLGLSSDFVANSYGESWDSSCEKL